jgi:hypothetical protein
LNNHFRGQAAENALQLDHMLTGRTHEAPESLIAAFPSLAGAAGMSAGPSQRRLF